MATPEANIKVTADIKQAERQLDKLTGQLEQLQRAGGLKFELFGSGAGLKNAISGNLPAALKRTGEAFGVGAAQVNKFAMAARNLDSQIKSGAIRGGVGALGLALAKMAPATAPAVKGVGALTTALTGLVAKTTALAGGLGGAGAAIAGVGAGIDTAAKAAVGGSNAIQELLLYLKDLPNSWGLAAVAAMAFAPAAITAGKAINTAVGTQATQKIAELTAGIRNAASAAEKLEGSVISAGNAFEALLQGSSLNQLNAQLRDAVRQSGEFESSTVQAWEAAQQLASAMKLQTVEQKKINDLVRQAKGLQTQDVRDTEVSRRMALLTSGRNAQKQMAAEQSRLNTELEDYARLAAEVAAQTKAWADNLTRVERSSKAGVLGNKSQIQARLEEMRANNRSAQIARERSAALQGKAYGLNQVPAGGQLFPGGNTMTAQPGYRAAQNAAATYKQAAEAAKPLLQQAQQRTILEGKSLQVVRNRTSALREQAAVDKNSIAILRQQNAERIKAAQLDERALTVARRQTQLADLRNKKKKGEDLQGRVENTLVSGAFPLLFGAGPLATIGGFAGGALGGKNPMIGVFTSAIGQILDTYAKSLTDLASSLKSPTDALAAMEAAGLKVSDSLRYTVEQLSASGRGYEAQARVIAELNRRLGTDTTQSLFALYAEQKKLTAQWDQAVAALQSEVIPAVTGAVTILNIFAGALRELAKVRPPKWMTDFLLSSTSKALTGVDLPGVFRGLQGLGINAGKGAQPPALDLKGQEAEIDRRVQSAAQERQLRQQGIDLERSAVDLRLNAEEAVYGLRRKAADIERSSIELRQSIEDAIFSKRQELARAESDNLRRQAQLSIERLDLSLSQIGKGDPTSKFEGSQLVTAAREYLRVRGEGEADLAQKERELKLKLADIDRDGTKFRLDVSKKSADLQLQASDYQRDVAKTYLQLTRSAEDYKVKVAEYQYAMAQRTYELAKQTGDLQQVQAAATPLTSGGGGAPMTAGGYIDKEVLRKWLISQGMGRTSGDFTNAGHRTPNHMLNAMDMGFTAPQYDRNYVQKTIEMERKLRATGAFGNQLFGPERDPRGHATHLHVPTPGGKVPLTPGLAALMGGKTAATTQMSPLFQRPGASTAPVPVVVTGATGATAATAPTAPTAPGIPALPAAPKLADISGVLNVYTALVDKSKSIEISSMELVKRWKELGDQKAAVELQQRFDEVLRKALGPMNEIVEDQKNSAAYQREYGALLADGVLPALAEQLAKIKQTYTQAKELLDYEVLSVEAAIAEAKARGQITTELEKELALLKEKLGLLDKQKEKAEEGAKQAQSPGERLQGAYDKVQGELNALLDPVNQVIAGANAIGSAFGTAFKDVASGAKSAQQALADAFQSIAGHFLDMAAQMIAKYIEMQVIGLAMNFLGSAAGGFGGFSGAGPVAMPGAGVGGGSSMFMPGAPSFMATGGFVTGPTKAMIGEGGESEYVIPSSKMGSAMARWNAGSRGSSVIDGADPTGGPSSTGGSGAMTISVTTGPVLQFEGRNYVTQDQFTSGMRSTAKQAEQQTLRRMQHSPSTRRKIGV